MEVPLYHPVKLLLYTNADSDGEKELIQQFGVRGQLPKQFTWAWIA